LAAAGFITLLVCIPLTSPALLVGSFLATIFWVWLDGADVDFGWLTPGVVLPIAFMLWMFLTLSWSPDKKLGFQAALMFLLFVGCALASLLLAPNLNSDVRKQMAIGLLVGAAIAITLLAIEVLTDMGMRRLLMSFIPSIRSQTQGTTVLDGWVISIPSFLIKKNIACMMLLFWPAALVARFLTASRPQTLVAIVFAALFVFAIARGGHDTSKVALLLSATAFVLAVYKVAVAHRAVLLLWTIMTLAVVPLMYVGYRANLYAADGIQFSGRHRIAIWGHTAELVLKRPIVGAGLATTRYLGETEKPTVVFLPGTEIPAGVNVHSHNIFLQVWHELGGIGALLLFLAGLPVIAWIATQTRLARPYLYATFVGAIVIASLSWSLIAVWFIAAFGSAAVLTRLAADFARDQESNQTVKA
jgi:O-antigen ligase